MLTDVHVNISSHVEPTCPCCATSDVYWSVTFARLQKRLLYCTERVMRDRFRAHEMSSSSSGASEFRKSYCIPEKLLYLSSRENWGLSSDFLKPYHFLVFRTVNGGWTTKTPFSIFIFLQYIDRMVCQFHGKHNGNHFLNKSSSKIWWEPSCFERRVQHLRCDVRWDGSWNFYWLTFSAYHSFSCNGLLHGNLSQSSET